MLFVKPLCHGAAGFFLGPYRYVWQDFKQGLEVLIQDSGYASFARNWLVALAGLVVCWQVYVPVHELLHVAGCLVLGGEVHELNLSPIYGASFLKEIFPFIRVGGEYAGRLTGFSTGGSDITYFITVFAPFILTLLFGVTLLHLALKRKSAFLFGASLVLAGAPFISITGDFLEMGGIIVTRLWHALFGFSTPTTTNEILYRFRSDDLFRLISEIWRDPAAYGVGGPWGFLRAVAITVLAQLTGVVLAGWTYLLGRKVAQGLVGRHGKG